MNAPTIAMPVRRYLAVSRGCRPRTIERPRWEHTIAVQYPSRRERFPICRASHARHPLCGPRMSIYYGPGSLAARIELYQSGNLSPPGTPVQLQLMRSRPCLDDSRYCTIEIGQQSAFEEEHDMAMDRPGPAAARKPDSPELKVPFDHEKLDALMDKAGIDALVVTSKHNIHYLLGGYRFFFFDVMDAVWISRYLPILVYPKGRPDQAAYFGNALETYEKQLDKFWTPKVETSNWGTVDAMGLASDYLRRLDRSVRTVGVEMGFLPVDAHGVLRERVPNCEMVESLRVLERLRAVKTPAELTLLREGSER